MTALDRTLLVVVCNFTVLGYFFKSPESAIFRSSTSVLNKYRMIHVNVRPLRKQITHVLLSKMNHWFES